MADISGLGAFGARPTNSAAESAFGGVDELLAAIDAEVDQANRAAAGAYEFVERMKGVRGEGKSKDGSVRIVVDSSGTPIEVEVPDILNSAEPFLRRFRLHGMMSVQALPMPQWRLTENRRQKRGFLSSSMERARIKPVNLELRRAA